LRHGVRILRREKANSEEIVAAVAGFYCPLVEITGGEPLLQKNVVPLMSTLCDAGYTVLLETNGARDTRKSIRAFIGSWI